jgi:hypothetical protein
LENKGKIDKKLFCKRRILEETDILGRTFNVSICTSIYSTSVETSAGDLLLVQKESPYER